MIGVAFNIVHEYSVVVNIKKLCTMLEVCLTFKPTNIISICSSNTGLILVYKTFFNKALKGKDQALTVWWFYSTCSSNF